MLLWCNTLIDLLILKNPCILGIKSTWSWCMIFLMCCWILFARILLRIFESVFISDIGLWFSCGTFAWSCYQGDGGLIERVWEFLFWNFLKMYCYIPNWHNLSCMLGIHWNYKIIKIMHIAMDMSYTLNNLNIYIIIKVTICFSF